MLFTVLTHGFRLVDQYWVQFVSMPAQAAVGASVFAVIVFYAAFEVVSAGAGPLVARASGAGDLAAVRRLLGVSFVGAFVIGLVVMLIGTLAASLIASGLGLSGETHAETVRYVRVLSLTVMPLVFTPLIDQVFLALGNARVPTILHALSLGTNALLTPLFILHFDLGVEGAALASSLARGLATVVGLWLLVSKVGLRWSDLGFGSSMRRIARVGTPMAASTLLYGGVYWALLATSVSPLGPHVNAALGIGFSALEGVTWPIFHGFALGTASFVGRYLGAGRPDHARRMARMGWVYSTVVGVAASLTFAFGAAPLTGLFTEHALVHAAATEYAVVLAYSQLFTAWESFGDGVLQGAGDTQTVFRWSVPFNLIRVPLAYLLAISLGYGAAGVWWAINITSWCKGGGKLWAVWAGNWQRLEP